jgi:hypothetical protein
MGFLNWFTRKRSTAAAAPPPPPAFDGAVAPAEWRKEFADKREAFIAALQAAVAGSSSIESRVFDAEEGYSPFLESVDGLSVRHDPGGLREAEAFLRHLIDEGHKVAFAVNRDGARANICVSYDADQEDWEPAWPDDFRVDVSQTSTPMTREW